MSDDNRAPTRREYLTYGGTVFGGSLLAGCNGLTSSGSASTRPGTETEPTPTPDAGPYSVTMSPVGEVVFDAVPEEAAVYDSQWVDHLVALGQGDRIVSMGFPDRFYTGYYDELPGVSFDTSGLTPFYTDGINLDKEILYELDADVHHFDPLRWRAIGTFDEADIEEIRTNIAPLFANRFSRSHRDTRDIPYEYYSLWELLDKYAQVYRVQSRSRALKQVRDEMLDSIHAELPPKSERPAVALVTYNPGSSTWGPYRLNGPGFGKAHTRPLRANDALEGGSKSYAAGAATNYSMEAMLEFDPDVLLHNFDWTDVRERTEAFFALDEHPLGKELTAVRNDRLYATGTPLQGPIMNLFQVELTAKQIYPGLFGQPPDPGESVPEGERLFDRQRVADIVTGEVDR